MLIKIHKRNIFLTVLACVFILSTKAQPAGFTTMKNTGGFKQKLTQVNQKTQTIQSDFVQEKHLDVFAEDIVSKGKFWYKKHNKLRWQYTHPFNYLIVINGENISIKDDKKVNRFNSSSNKVFKQVNQMMTDIIQGNIFSNTGDFSFNYFENATHFLVIMSPKSKDMKEFLQKINVYFDKNDLSVSRLTMDELSGDYTNITFTNKKMNQAISDEKFIVR